MEIGNQITFGGLATGLDSRAIIDALLGVEQVPILRLSQQKSRLSAQDNVYSTLDTRLNDLKSALESMDTSGELASYAATSSDETALGISASGSATQGAYDIDIVALAQAESRATAGFADKDTTVVGTGSFSVMVGTDTYSINVGGTGTLEDIRNAINDSDAPVNAQIIDNGSGTDPFQLVVSSDETGASNAFSVDLTGLTYDPLKFNIDNGAPIGSGGSQLQAGTDSHVKVNNLDVYRSSNTVTDIIGGVTLDLNSITTSSVQVTIDVDTDGIKSKIQDFVDAYNDIANIFSAQSEVSEEGETNAVLFGDSGIRSIASRLRSAISNQATSTGSNYTSLSSLGIRSDSAGKLQLDSADLEEAISNDLQGVLDMFSNSTDGLADAFKTAVDDLTDPVNGIIKSRRDGIASRQDNIDSRIETLEERLDRYEQRLIERYASLETLVSSFQAQGAALTGALG